MTDAPHPLLKPHVYIFDFPISGQHCPTKFVLLRDYDEALAQARRETWEAAAKEVENGRFLTNESPEYNFGQKVAMMLRRKAQENP